MSGPRTNRWEQAAGHLSPESEGRLRMFRLHMIASGAPREKVRALGAFLVMARELVQSGQMTKEEFKRSVENYVLGRTA